MSNYYIGKCELDWDAESAGLKKIFMDWVFEKRAELGASCMDDEKGQFVLEGNGCIDFDAVDVRMKELHKANPDAYFEFSSNVSMECEDNYCYSFDHDELDEDTDDEGN